MLIIDYDHCTGCEACVQICPQQCISMVPKEFDFLYPEIDKEKCIDCHLCEKACSINKKITHPLKQQAYAAVNKDATILKLSSSGGAFTELADAILKNGGVVYGVRMDDFVVHHVRIDSSIDLSRLRGSKYLQSRIGMTFKDAEKDLREGKKVLFTGTPCQIDGLKTFLGREFENLFTIDIVCHGVGSQGYFNKFITALKRMIPNAKEIRFRSKKYTGWSVSSGSTLLNDGTEKPFYSHENYYYQFFLQGDIYRRSCYSCNYANLDRPGDITLGDFWGVERLKLSLKTNNGCSLVIVNTEKGRMLLKQAEGLAVEPVPIEKAIERNEQLTHPSLLRERRAQRLRDYESKSGEEISNLYFSEDKINVLKGKIKRMIPYSFKVFIRRWI